MEAPWRTQWRPCGSLRRRHRAGNAGRRARAGARAGSQTAAGAEVLQTAAGAAEGLRTAAGAVEGGAPVGDAGGARLRVRPIPHSALGVLASFARAHHIMRLTALCRVRRGWGGAAVMARGWGGAVGTARKERPTEVVGVVAACRLRAGAAAAACQALAGAAGAAHRARAGSAQTRACASIAAGRTWWPSARSRPSVGAAGASATWAKIALGRSGPSAAGAGALAIG